MFNEKIDQNKERRINMKKTILAWTILVMALGICGAIWAQNDDQLPKLSIDNLLQISSLVNSSPRWSPDGSQIIFSSSLNNGGLVSISPEGGFPTRLPFRFSGASDPRWSPDGKWVSYISSKSGAPEIWIWSVSDGDHMQLTDLGGRINSLNWSPDSKWIAFADDLYGSYDIWKVAVPEGKVQRLTKDRLYEVFPSWAPDAKKILYVRMDNRWVDHDVIEITSSGGNPRLILSDKDFFDYREGRAFGYAVVSPDGKSLLFRSHRSNWINYWIVSLEGGEPKPITQEKADQSSARWSPDGKLIAYVSNHNGTHDLRIVPASGGKPRIIVSPEMGRCANPEWSPDGSRICYTFESPGQPNDLYVVTLKNRDIKRLTHSMPAGNLEKTIVMPEKITYLSPDSFTISAYLYKPAVVRAGDKFPGVIWIHGGPSSQFHDSFQQHVQFFVQRGYVILQPNVRGSSGYGLDFEKANNKCWGICDLKDVLAGAESLKALSYVDRNNIGVTGTSYGGILTMATVANAPEVFQAAIPCSGDADWARAYKDDHVHHVKMWDYELGPVKDNEDLYRKISPITNVENVTTPVFMPYGKGRYPESPQSELFAIALQKYSKVFRIKSYPGENYYVRRLENRRQMLLDMLEFFDKYLKNDKIIH